MPNKYLKAMSIFFGAAVLCSGIALATSLPLPPNTKIIREEVVETGGQDKKVVFCESGLNEEAVNSFYRRELEKQGYSIFMNQKNFTMYLKGKDMFMLMVNSPAGSAPKTSMVLTTGKMDNNPDVLTGPQECEDIPSVPAYPGAQCSGSARMKNAHAVSVKYTAPAEIADVAAFYRLKMAQNSWVIEKELPFAEMMGKEKLSGITSAGTFNFEDATTLVFKNPNNQRCTITVMPAVMGRGTLISILYEEKK